ncbi:MAG: type IX secretion system membrane protein PorP/SprF [Bacteroidales bacterium]|nr:type IX secretion system membrane protein PorP/SprF [Bacteroidales bacterium]
MMKRLFAIFIFGVVLLNLVAQQDPKFSQNMFLVPYLNPGAVGSGDKICLAAAFRNQWTGLPDAPVTTLFSAHMPVSFLGRTHGIGLNLMNDNLAFNNDFLFSASYAFRIDLGMGSLGIGTNVGLANQSLTPDWQGADVINPEGDAAIPQSGGSVFGFDMGLGVHYSTDNLYVGVSTSHLNQTSFDFPEDVAETKLIRHYYLMAGYNIQLTNPMFEILPSLMVQTDVRSSHVYLNTNLRYNKRFWGGVSYSVGGALTALFGVELMNGIKIGYSYDFELSPLLKYNSGSHEITVRYCFDLSVDKSPQKYKSIRFL